jgi:putative spermidine/putrescine transport system substrate-binding protein
MMTKWTRRLNGQRLGRRRFLEGATALGAAGTLPLFNINHAWSQDVTYDGEVFDAGGAVLNIAEWGGFWEENVRELLLNDFEREFNCRIAYDTSWPWFPKFVAGGAENPPVAITNWNLPEMFKTARAGDFFMPQDEVVANVPNAAGVWPFALANGVGITWAFGRYCYAYRSDVVDPAPTDFKSFWEDRFAGKRATYITSNTLFMAFFMMASKVFGGDETAMDAGIQAMRDAMPMKISDFTGNMQTLLARGEIDIGVQVDGEVYMQMDQGVAVAPMLWEEVKPILTQTKTISRYAEPMEKRLALALLNRTLDPAFITRFDEVFWLRPTHRDAVVPDNLANAGVVNSADAIEGLMIPNWDFWLENEIDIVETVNEIFAG